MICSLLLIYDTFMKTCGLSYKMHHYISQYWFRLHSLLPDQQGSPVCSNTSKRNQFTKQSVKLKQKPFLEICAEELFQKSAFKIPDPRQIRPLFIGVCTETTHLHLPNAEQMKGQMIGQKRPIHLNMHEQNTPWINAKPHEISLRLHEFKSA